jgi:hypothetical protein
MIIILLLVLFFGVEFVVVVAAYLGIQLIKLIGILLVISLPFFIYYDYEKQNERDKIAEEYVKKSKLENDQMMLEFNVWQKLTKKQKDSIRKSNERSIENSKIRCVKCKRELYHPDRNDYINGVGQACTECYIKDYIKKSKKGLVD